MSETAQITVGIPTYSRGDCVMQPIKRVLACRPAPAEVIVHVDVSDCELETRIQREFPSVIVLSSKHRIGPGGGRDRCLRAATQPYFVSFDDDSWPEDDDYFACIQRYFENYPNVACLEAQIYHRGEVCPERVNEARWLSSYTGCGYALRTNVYETLSGLIDRAIPYGLEEPDLSMQMHAAGWKILRCGEIRVFHDTELGHHSNPDITAGTIGNAALLAWLRYPVNWWPYALLQYVNVIRFMITSGRWSGILEGVIGTPLLIWKYRCLRKVLSGKSVGSYLFSRSRVSWR
jgi:GT2 family glycosyltransferase